MILDLSVLEIKKEHLSDCKNNIFKYSIFNQKPKK